MEYKRLGDICNPKQWKTISTSDLTDTGYPVYGANGIIGNYEEYNHKNETILVTCRGATCGSVNITQPYSYVNGNAMALDNLDKNIDINYLYFYLTYRGFNDVISGSAQPQIIRSAIEKVLVPVHPIELQNRLSTLLQNISKIRELYQKEIERLDELIKARFIEMFGTLDLSKQDDSWSLLSDVATIYTGTTPSTTDSDNWDGNILWITPAEISDDSFVICDTERKITEKGMKSKSLTIMPANTVLLSTRAPIGKVAIAGTEMCCNQGFKNFYCKSEILNPIYLYTILRNNNDFLNSLGTGTTFKEISKSNAGNIKVPLAKIELQNEFADFVKQVDKSKYDGMFI